VISHVSSNKIFIYQLIALAIALPNAAFAMHGIGLLARGAWRGITASRILSSLVTVKKSPLVVLKSGRRLRRAFLREREKSQGDAATDGLNPS
jgi:hypothetical protein